MSDLKPCPFCAEPASLNEKDYPPIGKLYGVSCTVCDCWCDYRMRTPALAIARWNTRLTTPSLPARLPQEKETPHG